MLSSKDGISFRHELGSALIKFDRLNQQSNLIICVDLNRYLSSAHVKFDVWTGPYIINNFILFLRLSKVN